MRVKTHQHSPHPTTWAQTAGRTPVPRGLVQPHRARPLSPGRAAPFLGLGRLPWPWVPAPTLGSMGCRGRWLQPAPCQPHASSLGTRGCRAHFTL